MYPNCVSSFNRFRSGGASGAPCCLLARALLGSGACGADAWRGWGCCAQVDSFSARIKPEAKAAAEEEEEGIGDVDLFALAGDGAALTVNAKWLQHLQVRRPSRAPARPGGCCCGIRRMGGL